MTRRRKGASDSCFYYKWLDKALCDLQAARLLLTYGGDHYNIAFHCQQAIEKALKGYLLFRTGRHFDGHNLTYLCRQAIQLDSKAFSEYLDESAALNDLYIETRNPTDLPFEIDELEVRRYLDMASTVQRLYKAVLPDSAAREFELRVTPVQVIAEKIRALGGTFQTSVGKDTDYLVAGEKVGASKLKKAESYGTKIINEDRLIEILG